MIDIQKIAREANVYAANQTNDSYDYPFIRDERFAALIREAVVQELVAGSGEPVAWMWKDGTITSDPDRADGTWTPLYAADQLAGTVLRERERCAQIAEDFPHDQLGCLDEVAAAIRSGE